MNTTHELLRIAQPARLKPIEEFAPNALEHDVFEHGESELTPWEIEVEEQIELEDALSHVVVSDEVRKECQRELAEAERAGWSL